MNTLYPVIIFVAGLGAIAFAAWLAYDVLRRDTGSPAMQDIANTIFEGAMAFLRRQYQTIALLAIVGAVVVAVLVGLFNKNTAVGNFDLAWRTAVAFVFGALCSGLAGFIGMYISVKANIRTAAAARTSLGQALMVSLRGGAVSGFLVVALSLLGVAVLFYAYGGGSTPDRAPILIVGYGFGASFVALFAQLGGGIYTKAADVGADLVGKVEAGIPEDDPRNAAVVADLVGDNVGDCAGRGADLFESTAAENIGAMILGISLYVATGRAEWIFFPLVIRAFGIVASLVGILVVRGGETRDPMYSLSIGYLVTAVLAAVAMITIGYWMLQNWWLVGAGLVGIGVSIGFVLLTEYYTGFHRPVKEIANASRTGPATNIISGFAVGLETTALTAVAIAIALGVSYYFGTQANLSCSGTNLPASILRECSNGILASHFSGIYATAVATMGMLMSAAYVLAMDTFGPITDNAGGITEMSQQSEEVRRITDRLDAAGNTTKALTKGYAIGSAALAAFLLFSAFLDEVVRVKEQAGASEAVIASARVVDLGQIEVFIGGFLGATLVFFFSSLAIRAVGRAAGSIIEEVRRQFRENPGIMTGETRPDYARCVDITTRAALREMVLPGVVAVAVPVIVGIALGEKAEAGVLMVGTIAGVILATVLNNSGGSWDNAKKYIEQGSLKDDDGTILGKRTPAHAAAVVGDTVGDPFKDTAGPSLHVLIKLLSTITLVLAPIFIRV